jgi:hypothetical protein
MSKTTTCTHHCSACGGHFHSLRAFELHRAGEFASADPETGRRCLAPVEVLDGDGGQRLEALNGDGECRMYAARARGVTVWAERGSRDRFSELLLKRVRPSENESDLELGRAA